MNKEDKKLQKHLVDEMMKVSKTNPDVIIYMEALMKKYEELEQENEILTARQEIGKTCGLCPYYSNKSKINKAIEIYENRNTVKYKKERFYKDKGTADLMYEVLQGSDKE